MHEVVPMAVRNAVSAATITFTANSMIFCFFIRFSFLFGGAGDSLLRLKARDYSAAESSALRVIFSPPKLGGVRGGLNAGSVNPPGVFCARLCRLLPEGRKNMG